MPNSDRDLQLVVWGATGYTGKLVAEHLVAVHGRDASLRWAIGGRNVEKLEALAADLEALGGGSVPVVVGDSLDRASLDRITKRSAVVCSTVGPYARYGSELVASCVEQGTHYCDLSGEVQWMRNMIDRYHDRARETGSRIVHCCGFDSIPSDLGCFLLQQYVRQQTETVCSKVQLRVLKMKGGFSGGTVASLLNVMDESRRDPEVRRIVRDPYALNPEGERSGPDGPDQRTVCWDEEFQGWTAPFVMASINTRVVRRTNALLGYAYGRDFRYDEAVLTGRGRRGWFKAQGVDKGLKLLLTAAAARPTRRLLQATLLPQSGEGPSRQEREGGSFALRLRGTDGGERSQHWSLTVTGNSDPGYGCTAKMLAESAMCLVREADSLPVGGGFWTPAMCFGSRLQDRLESHAGMRFLPS